MNLRQYLFLFLALFVGCGEDSNNNHRQPDSPWLGQQAAVSPYDTLARFMHNVFVSGDTLALLGRPFDSFSLIADLDGDKTQDRIVAYFYSPFEDRKRENPSWSYCTLVINDSSIQLSAVDLEPVCELVDIDTTDSYLEVALADNGASDDYATYFCRYSHKQPQYLGIVEGANIAQRFEDIEYPGNGEIKTRKRGQILHTWFYPATYQLNNHHRIEFMPQPLYEMNTRVEVVAPLRLVTSPMDSSHAFTLTPGSSAIIKASDDARWCLVHDSAGQAGWFAVEGISTIAGTGRHAADFFKGLSYAD